MHRNHWTTTVALAAASLSGCGTPFGATANDLAATLQLNMREITENELTLTAPDDVSFECDESLNGSALARWLSSAGVESSCGGATVVNDFIGLSDDCGATGAAVVTWMATDDCGNSISHTATFQVADTNAPAIRGPADVSVACQGGAAAQALQDWLDSSTAADGCGRVVLTREDIRLSDGCGRAGSTRSTWTAVDACGNTSTHKATFTIEDTSPVLVVVPPVDVEVECDGAGNQSAFDRWVGAASTEGACGDAPLTHEITRSADDCGGASRTQVTWTATDDCDATASASAVFSIVDTTAPSMAQPEALELECGAPDNRPAIDTWLGSVRGRDGCSDVAVTNDFEGLRHRCGAAGAAVVTWTATDDCGNAAAVSADLRIADTMAPTLTVPEDRRFCTGGGDLGELRRWLGAANAEDACGDVDVEHDFSRERVPASCVFDVTWTATDACGHSTSDSATAGVQDSDPPLLTLNGPAELTLECNVDSYNEHGASVEDACDIELTRGAVGGDEVDVATPGVYTVRYDAEDLCGNEAEPVTRSVEVVDTLPPFAPDGIALELWPPNHQYASLTLADCVRDLCEIDLDVNAVGQIVEVYSDEPEDADGDGNTMNDIVLVDHSAFLLRVERQGGGNGRVYGITFDISDSAGNATRDTCLIAVPHDQSGTPAVDDGAESGYLVHP